jgi:hypothetical protein
VLQVITGAEGLLLICAMCLFWTIASFFRSQYKIILWNGLLSDFTHLFLLSMNECIERFHLIISKKNIYRFLGKKRIDLNLETPLFWFTDELVWLDCYCSKFWLAHFQYFQALKKFRWKFFWLIFSFIAAQIIPRKETII